jgi:membrane dipeptidase
MKYLYIGLIGVLTCACGVKKQYAFIPEDEKMYEQAVELAHKYIITDGHVDLPYRLKVQNFQLTGESGRIGCAVYVHIHTCQTSTETR